MTLPSRSQSRTHVCQRGRRLPNITWSGGYPISHGVAATPQVPPLRAEAAAVKGGGGSLWGGRRVKSSLPVPPHPTPTMFQNPPLLKGAQREFTMAPHKRRAQATTPRPHLTIIPDELSEYIARESRLVRDLVWEDFVKDRRGWG